MKRKPVSVRPRLFRLFTPQHLALLTAVVTLSISLPLLIGGQITFDQLASLSWPGLIALLLLLVTKWGLNTLRCQVLFRANGIRLRNIDALTMIWLYDAAAEGTPGGLGGPIVGWTLLRRRQVPSAMIAGVGLFILALDIIAIIVLLLWVLLTPTLLHEQAAHWQVMVVLVAILFVLALPWVALLYRHELIRYMGRLSTRLHINKPRYRPHVRLWLRLGQIVERLMQLPRLSLFVLVLTSIGHWCCRLSILYVAILAMGQHIAWADTFFIQIISGLTGMVVGLPGGFLGADMTMTALLLPVMDIKSIATVILLWRLLTFHTTLLVGGLAFAWQAGRLLSYGESRSQN